MSGEIGLFPLEVWMHNIACNEVKEFSLLLYDVEGAHNKS